MDLLMKKRFHFLIFIVGVIILSITAEKCRKLVGEEAASKSGQFTFLNCFDGGSGTLACLVKEGVKLYTYNIKSAHAEKARNQAIENAVADAISQGLNAKDAAKQIQKEGAKAAKLANRQAKRIIGPIISSGWDFFEAVYFGGTMTEGFLRGVGTLFGTYAVGFTGEQKFGRFGYLVGSHLGSWVGGRIGLMVYDVVNGVNYLLYVAQTESSEIYTHPLDNEDSFSSFGSLKEGEDSVAASESLEHSEDSNAEPRSSEVGEDSFGSESPAYENSEAPDGDSVYNTYTEGSSEFQEEL